MLSHELFVFEAADAEAVVFEDDVVDDVEDGASSRSLLMQVTRSGAIIGKRSVRLSKSARLLPMPSSSFSEGVTEEQVAPTCADDPLLATALTGLK